MLAYTLIVINDLQCKFSQNVLEFCKRTAYKCGHIKSGYYAKSTFPTQKVHVRIQNI